MSSSSSPPPPSTPTTTVRPSTIPNAGLGLFATQDLPANHNVIEYLGEILTYKEATRRTERRYLKMIDINKHIDAADPAKSNAARYCNDTCIPSLRNCKFHVANFRAWIQTTRAISQGEELFVDYGRGHWLFCEDASIAEPFLGLGFVPEGVVAKQAFHKGEFLCCSSSPLWSNGIGPGFGAAIRRAAVGCNCATRKNPFLKGTIMIVATRDIGAGEVLILEIPSSPPPSIPSPGGYYATSPRAAVAIVTGFGPFHGVSSNPTTQLLRNLQPYAKELGLLGLFVSETSMQGVDATITKARIVSRAFAQFPRLMPLKQFWIHFGVWEGQDKFNLEHMAYNEATFAVPDERKNQPRGKVIESNEEFRAARCTALDVKGMGVELAQLGFPVVENHDPGRFICNYMYYRSLQAIEAPMRGNWGHDDSLFVHVPSFDVVGEQVQLEFAKELLVRVCSARWAGGRNAVNVKKN